MQVKNIEPKNNNIGSTDIVYVYVKIFHDVESNLDKTTLNHDDYKN